MTPALAREGAPTASDAIGPAVPFLAEPVLPEPSLRLQGQVIALSHDLGGVRAGDFLVPLRFLATWKLAPSLVAEASLPLLLTFPGTPDGAPARSTAADIGNARFGIEWPACCAAGPHRLSLSLDAFLPLSQVTSGDSGAADLAAAAERRTRYALAAALLPNLASDYLAETLSIVPGVHYRYADGDVTFQVGVELPAFLALDVDRSAPFHESHLGVRYGIGAVYDARPIVPTFEVVGLTTFAHDDPAAPGGAVAARVDSATTVLAAIGLHAVIGDWQPGLAVSYPFTLGGDVTRDVTVGVYLHLELAYSLDRP